MLETWAPPLASLPLEATVQVLVFVEVLVQGHSPR